MNTTILDNLLRENNLYCKNGLVFSSTKPKIFLGNISEILPKLLKNKSQLAKSESEI